MTALRTLLSLTIIAALAGCGAFPVATTFMWDNPDGTRQVRKDSMGVLVPTLTATGREVMTEAGSLAFRIDVDENNVGDTIVSTSTLEKASGIVAAAVRRPARISNNPYISGIRGGSNSDIDVEIYPPGEGDEPMDCEDVVE